MAASFFEFVEHFLPICFSFKSARSNRLTWVLTNWVLCYLFVAPVHQMQQYYRHGGFDNCFGKWNDLFDCLNLKTKSSSEAQVWFSKFLLCVFSSMPTADVHFGCVIYNIITFMMQINILFTSMVYLLSSYVHGSFGMFQWEI